MDDVTAGKKGRPRKVEVLVTLDGQRQSARYRVFGWPVACWAVVMAIAGCGKAGPQVQYVEGVVLLDGAPVADVTVVFVPKADDGLVATGRSKADGHFTLTSVRGGKPNGGALIGEYAVTFTKADYDLKGTGKTRDDDMDGVPLLHLIPPRYGEAAKSGLTATVKKGHNAGPEFQFELVSGGNR